MHHDSAINRDVLFVVFLSRVKRYKKAKHKINQTNVNVLLFCFSCRVAIESGNS
jgi:hypothetical protein